MWSLHQSAGVDQVDQGDHGGDQVDHVDQGTRLLKLGLVDDSCGTVAFKGSVQVLHLPRGKLKNIKLKFSVG